jgi:fatty acid amide hydrolase 2
MNPPEAMMLVSCRCMTKKSNCFKRGGKTTNEQSKLSEQNKNTMAASRNGLISGFWAAAMVIGAFAIGLQQMSSDRGIVDDATALCKSVLAFIMDVSTTTWMWIAFYAIFITAVLLGGFYSWVHGKIVASRPHTRPCPETTVAPCMLLSATKLSAAFEAGTLSSVYVTECYIRHIQRINPFLNALVYELYDEAREQARAADAKWAAWRKNARASAKPHWLTGVPCTIKECIHVKGCPNTSGHPRRKHIVSASDSATVARLRAAGCVFLGLTNVSELCMWMEANNKVYGITCNPYDTRRLVGGSSGGEGAAVAACFSAFGLGSDVGGSIRMPAFFNGVYGYKASAHLIPNRGQHPGARAKINHLLTTGPLCRFAEDLLPLSKALAEGGFLEDAHAFTPCPPLPATIHANLHNVSTVRNHQQHNNAVTSASRVAVPPKKKLRVFAITDFGLLLVPVAESQKQAVLRVAAHLEQRYDADVIILNIRDPSQNRPVPGKEQVPKDWNLFKLTLPMWTAHMTHDKNERSFIDFMSEGSMEGPIEPYGELLKWIFGKSAHTAMSVGLCVIEKTDEIFNSNARRDEQLRIGFQFREALQRELGDDAIIICPTYPFPAPKHHEPTWMPFQWQYTAAFNISQSPAINLPVWDNVPCGSTSPSYEAARAAGLPADHYLPKGVQVVSGWGNDGLALSVATILERDGVCGYRYPSWISAPEGVSLSPYSVAV